MKIEKNYEIPITLFVFKRLETVKMIIEVMKEFEPKIIYIFGDGPRDGVIGEKEKVDAVIEYIKNNIDWDCNLFLEFSKTNQGCSNNIRKGFDYVLTNHEMGVFLEDDAIPSLEFFEFVRILLEKYKNNDQIQYIAGFNAIGDNRLIKDSYSFGHTVPMSGAIATWSDRWFGCDIKAGRIKEKKTGLYFRNFYFYNEAYNCARKEFDNLFIRGDGEWDIQFQYDMLEKERYAIVPKVNLAKSYGNIEASHETSDKAGMLMASFMDYASNQFQFPMVEPKEISWNKEYDKRRQYIFLRVNGNYFVRHIKYAGRFIKDILYKYMPCKIWCFFRDLLNHDENVK